MFDYLKRKIKKMRARRVFQEYETQVVTFQLPAGEVKFAQWLNPLEKTKEITQDKVDFFRQFIRPGEFAIDIGTHTGDTTIPMALATGTSGRVLGLDPNPYIFKILEQNCQLNKGLVNIDALNAAATAEDGEFYYNSSEASFNNGGIAKNAAGRNGKFVLQTRVKGIRLEKYLNQHYAAWLTKLALIKVDTEGYDAEVLKSLHTIIETYKPFVIMECFGKLTEEERLTLYNTVGQFGYTLYYFDDFQKHHQAVALKPQDMTRWKHFDLYAIPPGKTIYNIA